MTQGEQNRHEKYINLINSATNLSELPRVSWNDIAVILASKEYYGKKISKDSLGSVIDSIKKYGIKSEKVIYNLSKVIMENCDMTKDYDIEVVEYRVSLIYKKIIDEGKIVNLYEEIKLAEEKKKELLKQEEDKRHKDLLNKIGESTKIEELPSISYSDITKYLASKEYFGNRISQSAFRLYTDTLVKYGNPMHDEVVATFKKIVKLNAGIRTKFIIRDEELDVLYVNILKEGYINHIISELGVKSRKVYRLQSEQDYKLHMVNMCVINNCFEEKDFPKIGIGELNRLILRAVNSNSFRIKVKTADIEGIAKVYLTKGSKQELELAIEELVNKMIDETSNTYLFNRRDLKLEILGSLLTDHNIDYRVEEIIAIEKRRRKIYEMNHDELMDTLKEATRMYQLPSISFSTLTSYLCGNSTIYPNDNSFKSEHLKKITELLLAGKKWEDEEIINELKRICAFFYPSKSEEAFNLLFKKLTALPKTYYLVDEINLIKNLQQEFIANGQSNVNVYFVPNPKAPSEGGKFYNVYINRVGQINLDEVLPLDLNSIVAPGTDIDAVEWLVGKVDKTFKKVGGIILYRDETIGNITVYKVNDGKVSISKEDKVQLETVRDKVDKLDELDSQISSKEARISELDEMIKSKEEEIARLIQEREEKDKERLFINASIERIIIGSKGKLLRIRKEINESLDCLEQLESGYVKKIETPKE